MEPSSGSTVPPVLGSTNVPSDLVISPVTGSGVSAVVSDWLLSVVPESSELG